MDRLRCVVERITYQNETNGYTVMDGSVPEPFLLAVYYNFRFYPLLILDFHRH